MKYGFDKSQRSSFGYWFSHWCAFQMIALNLHIWKPKYLFHDIEKPWLKLFLPYEDVKTIHRYHNKHHVEWMYAHELNYYKLDLDAMIIDNECSRFSKSEAPLTAIQYFTRKKSQLEQEFFNGKFNELDDIPMMLLSMYGTLIDRAKELGLKE